MAEDPKKPAAPGALDKPLDNAKETPEDDENTEVIEQKKDEEHEPPPETSVKKEGKMRKIILKGDNAKILYEVTNTGKNDLDVAVALKDGKPVNRIQAVYGMEIKIGAGETILVSQGVKRFFSASKGYFVAVHKKG